MYSFCLINELLLFFVFVFFFFVCVCVFFLSGHRGYGSTEADKLSFDRLQPLIPEEERRSNGHDRDCDPVEDVGKGSEPDSPSSPGWDEGPRSPILDLRPFQGEVEEGMLVNVAGSPGDELEGIDHLDFVKEDNDDDDADGEVEDFQPEELACVYPTHEELPESEQHEDKHCSEEEPRDSENFDDVHCKRSYTSSSEIRCEGENSFKSPSPELPNNHENQRLNDDDLDHKSVSDSELADLLKTLNSDEG